MSSIDVEVDSSKLQIDDPAEVGGKAGRRLPSSTLQIDTPAEGDLYTGRRLPRAEKYALHGVINGFIPNDREPRGGAWIHCSGPNMWACAAPALGFTVRGVNVNCDGFITLLECMDQAPEKRVPQGVAQDVMRRQNLEDRLGEVQVVFTDYEALPDYSRSRVSYWDNPHWQVPHVLFVELRLMPLQPPPEWSSIDLRLTHSHLGGSTTANWGLVALLPPSFTSCVPYNLPPQPWLPMHSRLNRMIGGDVTAPPAAARQISLEFSLMMLRTESPVMVCFPMISWLSRWWLLLIKVTQASCCDLYLGRRRQDYGMSLLEWWMKQVNVTTSCLLLRLYLLPRLPNF